MRDSLQWGLSVGAHPDSLWRNASKVWVGGLFHGHNNAIGMTVRSRKNIFR
jgi:hypothetical protein